MLLLVSVMERSASKKKLDFKSIKQQSGALLFWNACLIRLINFIKGIQGKASFTSAFLLLILLETKVLSPYSCPLLMIVLMQPGSCIFLAQVVISFF
ncbi:hypothetical protein ABE66_05195 [Cytobacillus firmus]|nr:hypothetical protein [Cytobacillus firmus]